MKPVRIGIIAFVVHLALTLGLSWLTMLMRMEEMQGPGEPTLLTQMLFGLLTLLALPLRWLVPVLFSAELAGTLTPLLLPLNSAIWGLLAYGFMRWRQARLSMLQERRKPRKAKTSRQDAKAPRLIKLFFWRLGGLGVRTAFGPFRGSRRSCQPASP